MRGYMKGRVTIGLYNTYDRQKFREAHRRALARAAPLAMAFDFNLTTFGFPFPEDRRTPMEIAEFVADSTTIGEGGRYFLELAEKGRFMYFPYPRSGFPPQMGTPVITTSKPFVETISPEEIGKRSSFGESFLIVFGLGPHGMSKKEKELGRYHMDLTGKGISMETCTAMGAVSSVIWNEIKTRT
jgi:hypothetical protein